MYHSNFKFYLNLVTFIIMISLDINIILFYSFVQKRIKFAKKDNKVGKMILFF